MRNAVAFVRSQPIPRAPFPRSVSAKRPEMRAGKNSSRKTEALAGCICLQLSKLSLYLNNINGLKCEPNCNEKLPSTFSGNIDIFTTKLMS